MYFFQIFERFTDLSSTGGKNASQVQRTTVTAIRFVLKIDPEKETSSEGTKRAPKRQKNFSRQILRRGSTTVGSARKCTRFNPLQRQGIF
jgi:hypothetical protein